MYQRTIRIGLFGVAEDLSNAIKRITPFDRFTHEVEQCPSFDPEAFCACNVAIIDAGNFIESGACKVSGKGAALLPSRDLAELSACRRARCGTHFSAVIIIANDEATATWTADDYALIDAIWAPSLTAEQVAFNFNQLQRAARQNAELYLAQTYLDTGIDSIPELIWFKDAKGSHLKVNDAFCTTVEKTKEQVEGRGHYYIWDITPEEYASGEYVCLESETETMESGCTCLFDEQVKTKRGMRQFKTYKSPLIDEDGRVMGTVGIAHDVTDLDNIATELDILINAVPFAVVVEDAAGSITNVNHMTESYFDVKRNDVVGGKIKDWRRIVFGDKVADEREIEEGAEFTACIGGTEKTFEMKKEPIVDVFGNQTGQLRLYRDITSERELERRAIMAARTDYLTGLYNRRYFYEYLEEQGDSRPTAFILLDLDDFKSINDRYGHAVGDTALVKASDLLRETFPESPVVRWGGDELITIVYDEEHPDKIVERTQGMLERLSAESADIAPQPFTGSVGIAFADDPRLSVDELIKQSDIALYRAKHAGKSRCVVYKEA